VSQSGRPTVLHVIGGADTGGAMSHLLPLLSALRRAGCDARLLALGAGGLADAARARDIPVRVLPMRNAYDPRMLRSLRTVLSATPWDVVHTHGMRANLPVRLLFRTLPREERPCLFTTVHSDLELDYGSSLKVRAYGLLERGSVPVVDRIVCVSDGLRRRLEERGYDSKRLLTIHSGVELERLGLSVGQQASGAAAHPPTIATVARLVPVKDIGLLLEVAARLRPEFPELRVVVVGDGSERGRLEATAAAIGVADMVSFAGWVDDVAAALAGVDVFVLTSVFEGGVSLAVVEAMALELPVAATDVGGVAEAVIDGVTGYVVPRTGERADIVVALADKVARLLGDPPARRRLGAAGAARVAAQFTVERAAQQTIAAYLGCIEGADRIEPGWAYVESGAKDGDVPKLAPLDALVDRAAADAGPASTGHPDAAGSATGLVLHDRDIVCVSSLDYDAPWTSKQQIMHRLAAGNRVLYVEEPVTMLAPLRVPTHWRRYRFLRPQLGHPEAGLWTLRLPPLLPFGNVRPFVNRLNQRVIGGYVRWAVRRLRLRDPLLWTYLPTSIDLLDRVPFAALVYHCVDEHSAFPGFVDPGVVQAYDRQLTSRADLVVTTAENLRLARRNLNPHVYHVANGADVEAFARALDPSLVLPADVAAIPEPRIGVIGVHDSRLDIDALEALAAAEPSWQLVLVGPLRVSDDVERRLRVLPNLHLLGGKPVDELPAYLKALSVALIPYRLNELSRNIFPLKLFEYLAGGVPVVSAALPELEQFRGLISLALSPAEYPDLVRRAMAEDGPEPRRERIVLAAQNSWDHRVHVISQLVVDMLARKETTP
jgi:glycosyltransferase involved in cell wall biosynthesis